MSCPEQANPDEIPVIKWLECLERPLATTPVPHAGSLSTLEQAQIANWFEAQVSEGNKELRVIWMGLLPLAHAYTLYIAYRLKSTSSLESALLLQKAWEVQLSATPQSASIDVDQESLVQLEEQMFERSLRAGVAGNFQWGLDAGGHQDGWDPYHGLPLEWSHGNREENKAELQVGPEYVPVVKKTAPVYVIQGHPSLEVNPVSPLGSGPALDEKTMAKVNASLEIFEKSKKRAAKREAQEAINKASLRCRCGATGPILDDESGLPVVECVKCTFSSHIACQRHGRASDPKRAKLYMCDICLNPYNLPISYHIPPTRGRKPALSKRLQPGKGALCQFGKYWFPVRLLYKNTDGKWRVKWHPSCEFGDSHPGADDPVDEVDLVDELWQEHKARRMIRLGKWTHENDLEDEDDILLTFSKFPYTSEINDLLFPHKEILSALMHVDFTSEPDSANELDHLEKVPVVRDIRESLRGKLTSAARTRLTGGLVTDFGHGPIESITHARILNWFLHNVPKADESRLRWLGCVPDAHALTIYYASTRKDELISSGSDYPESGSDSEKQTWLWNAAWEYQSTPQPRSRVINVDNECLRMLEERMFENSKKAGKAGNQQWGLDVGAAKGRWNPYDTLPPSWNHTGKLKYDPADSEDDMRGPNFSEGTETETDEQTITRPQPTHRTKDHVA